MGWTRRLTRLLEGLRDVAQDLRDGQDTTLRLPIEGTLVKMADTLAGGGRLVAGGRPGGEARARDISPELKDAKLRIRDLQGLLLQNMFQLGGPAQARAEARVWEAAAALLPLFAALRQADRMELADAFITGVVDYASGRRRPRRCWPGWVPTPTTGSRRAMSPRS